MKIVSFALIVTHGRWQRSPPLQRDCISGQRHFVGRRKAYDILSRTRAWASTWTMRRRIHRIVDGSMVAHSRQQEACLLFTSECFWQLRYPRRQKFVLVDERSDDGWLSRRMSFEIPKRYPLVHYGAHTGWHGEGFAVI